jgi:2-polyprenyl-3-methyl-5-hydroxy-6-metoxy-1,4-benzoquinol methylase
MEDNISFQNQYIHNDSLPKPNHRIIVPALLRLLPKEKNLKILDIGCGNGSLDNVIHNYGYNIVGLDSSNSGISFAMESFPEIKFIHGNIYNFNSGLLPEKDFDIVIAMDIIEHLQFPRELLSFAKKFLKPSGTFILSTPYHGYIKNLAISILGKWDYHHAALSNLGHIKFFSRKSLSQLLLEEGFLPTKFKFAGRLPLLWESMLCSAVYRDK